MPEVTPPRDTDDAPDAPVCPDCGGHDLRRAGRYHDRQRYACRACGRYSYGVAAPRPAPPPPCPRCGGRATRAGHSPANGRQRYHCQGDCKRRWTEGVPPRPPLPLAPDPVNPEPVCAHCGASDLAPAGKHDGKRRYACRTCGRSSYGVARPDLPCPYCGKRCRPHGHSENGSRRYRCTACDRTNTGLWPADKRPEDDGPCPHRFGLYLNPSAAIALDAYCQRYGCSERQAIRAIFRRAASNTGFVVASVPRDGRRRRPEPTLPPPPEPLHLRLPDLRPEAARKRCKSPGGAKHGETVHGVRGMTVMLDDLAYTGLLRTMRRRGLNHQDAARALLAEAHPLRQPFFARD